MELWLLDLVGLLVTFSFLAYGSWKDVLTREITNRLWLVYYPVGLVLLGTRLSVQSGSWLVIAVSIMITTVLSLGLALLGLTVLLFAGFIAANVVLLNRSAYALVDRVISATPLARIRPRAASLYEAITPYAAARREIGLSILLSFAFQGVVIGVVFLNAHALHHDFPLTAVAVFVPLISLGGMLPVSVNGLGVREALYILLFGRVGATTELAVALALLYLAVTFVASLPGGVLYAMQGARVPPAVEPR
jgi:hypothetical protein